MKEKIFESIGNLSICDRVKFRSKVLERLSATYRGADLSTSLNFNTHINRTSSNANKSLSFIKRNIKTKYAGVREAAYKTNGVRKTHVFLISMFIGKT